MYVYIISLTSMKCQFTYFIYTRDYTFNKQTIIILHKSRIRGFMTKDIIFRKRLLLLK